MSLRGRSLLTLAEFRADEIEQLLALAAQLKREKRERAFPRRLAQRNLALIFLKPSCRTRLAFAVAAADEGAQLEVLRAEDIRFGVKESVKDVARVLGRMFDGIAFRGFEHQLAVELARYSGVPVWNGLCDLHHPTQVLADALTMQEAFGTLTGLSLAYVGDARNNQARSLMVLAGKLGLDLRLLAPESLQPNDQDLRWIEQVTTHPAAQLTITDDAARALEGAAVVYGDVWASMGEEAQISERIRLLAPYRITSELLARTQRADTIFLHCLPAFHDGSTEYERRYPGIQETSDEVFEGPQSRVFDQAENRMHTIKAVLVATV